MNFYKISALAVLPLLLGATACTDEVSYTPAEPSPMPEAYFSLQSSKSWDVEEGTSSVPVTLYRAEGGAPLTVNITSEAKRLAGENITEAPVSIFNFPTQVTFADGQDAASFDISFNFDDLEPLAVYAVTTHIEGAQDTPYLLGDCTTKITFTPWQKVIGKNGEDMCTFLNTPLSGITQNEAYASIISCPIYKHPNKEIYRLIDAWGPEYNDILQSGLGDYDDEQSYKFEIDCTNPEMVRMPLQDIGWRISGLFSGLGNGATLWGDMVDYFKAGGNSLEDIFKAGYFGTFKDGIIKYNPGDLGLQITSDPDQSMYYGIIKTQAWYLAMPGYKLPGTEPVGPEIPNSWTSIGECEYTDGFVGPFIGSYDVTQTLEIEQNDEVPTVYRVVDPWLEDLGENGYLQFNVANPNYVIVYASAVNSPVQAGGQNATVLNREGYLMIDENMTEEKLPAAMEKLGGEASTLSGTTVTIPLSDQLYFEGDWTADTEMKAYNPKIPQKATTIVLPDTPNKSGAKGLALVSAQKTPSLVRYERLRASMARQLSLPALNLPKVK